MKRLLAFLLAVLCIVSIITGCKQKEQTPSNEKIPVTNNDTAKEYDIPVNEDLKYDINFEEYITLPDIASLELDYRVIPNTKESVEQNIYSQQLAKAKRTEVTDRPAQDKDIVTINYKIVYYGTDEVVSDRKDIELSLGYDMAIPALEEAVLGMSKGETKVTDIVYPADYTTNKLLANSKTTFTIELTKIETAELPELNAETIKSFGLGVSTYEELYRYFSDAIGHQNFLNKSDALYKALMTESELISMPADEYNYYIELFDSNAKAKAESMGVTLESLITTDYGSEEEYNTARARDAQDKVQNDLVVYALKEKYGIEMTKKQYNEALNTMFKDNAASVGITSLSEFHEKMGSSVYKGELTYMVLEAAAKDAPDKD